MYILYIYIYIDAFAQVFFACNIVRPPAPLFLVGVWTFYQIFKRGGVLREFQFLEESYLERRGGLFKGGFQFLHGE